jgi:hypothetical protein
MRSREDFVLFEPRKRLIDGLVHALAEAPVVLLPMKEVASLWAERRGFENWLADAGLKLSSTIIAGASGEGVYKICKNLPLGELVNGTNWGMRRTNMGNVEPPRNPRPNLW